MRIKFVKECGFTIVEEVDNAGNILQEYDETFNIGDTHEGDIIDDNGSYVNFQFSNGSMIFGLGKDLYIII